MENEVGKSARHALAHGTAKTKASHGGYEAKPKGGKEEGPDGKDGKKELAEMSIKPSKNGGHVITHRFHPPEDFNGRMPEDETYTAQDLQGLHQHIDEHLGGAAAGNDEPAEEMLAQEHGGGEGGAEGSSQA